MSQIVTKFVNNLAITEAKIANAAVTTNKVADNAIVTAKIANDAITSSKIATAAITTTKIDNNAVTTSKVADNAINGDKIKLLPDQPLRARNRDDDNDIDLISWQTGADLFDVNNIKYVRFNAINSFDFEFGVLILNGTNTADFGSRVLYNSNGDQALKFSIPGAIEILPQNNTTQSSLRFLEASQNGTNYIALRAPASVPSDYTITLPASAPTAGQILQSDGSGNLSWITPASNTPNYGKETFVLTASDISNGYVDLAEVAIQNSIVFLVRGAGVMLEGASYDYSVNYTGGNGGKTRITWLNDLATNGAAELVAGDVLQIQYQY